MERKCNGNNVLYQILLNEVDIFIALSEFFNSLIPESLEIAFFD